MSRPPSRSSIVFNGWRYTEAADGYWKANRTKHGRPEHWVLHRAVWAAANGPIPDGWDIVHADGDRSNNDLSNLQGGPRSRRPFAPRRDLKRSYVDFRGIRYYLAEDGYYKATTKNAEITGHHLLHRAVWAATNGPIPEGIHIHHIDHDRTNNDPSNLRAMSVQDHLQYHKANPTGAAAEDSATRSRRRKEEWTRKRPRTYVCDACGNNFESTGQRAKFCTRSCRRRHYYRMGIG